MSRAKQRGKYFERKIVELLRKELSLPKWCLFRNIASGTAEHEIGDIWVNPCCFKQHFVFECKYRKSLPKNLLTSSSFKKWLSQLEGEISKYREIFDVTPIGVIFIGQPYKSALVIVYKEGKSEIKTLEEFIAWIAPFVRR